MSEIRTRPASKEFRANFDRVFKKKGCSRKMNIVESEHNRANFDRIFKKRAGIVQLEERLSCKQDVEGSTPSIGSNDDEYIDWGEIKTIICCTDDPHFGG